MESLIKKLYILAIVLLLSACGRSQNEKIEVENDIPDNSPIQINTIEPYIFPPSTGQIYMLGEEHFNKYHLELQLEFWDTFYNEHGMRYLFIEYEFSYAELLNMWMRGERDEILDVVENRVLAAFEEKNREYIVETLMEFYNRIKNEFPETIFYGLEVEYTNSSALLILQHLRDTEQEESELFRAVIQRVRQHSDLVLEGKRAGASQEYFSFYNLRERDMTENFIKKFDSLQDESVMAIFGAYHVIPAPDFRVYGVPNVANRLIERYGEQVTTISLEDFVTQQRLENPTKVEIEINGNVYEALLLHELIYSEEKFPWYGGDRRIYFIEGAYEDFRNYPKSGVFNASVEFAYIAYFLSVHIEAGQVFIFEQQKSDGSIDRQYGRVNDDLVMERFYIKSN